MTCTNCRREIEAGGSFCPCCGAEAGEGSAQKLRAKRKKTLWITAALTVCASAVFLSACGGEETSPPDGGDAVPALVQETEETEHIDNAKAYIEQADYYNAVKELLLCEEETEDAAVIESCEELYLQIEAALKESEPETGEELERTFQYKGGGEYHVTAESGPVEMTVFDLDNAEQYVRFYVRQGETAVIHLPGGRYTSSCKVGGLWYGDEIGFGEHCASFDIDGVMEYEVAIDNAWITNSVWEITI